MIGKGSVIAIGGNEDKRPHPDSILGSFVRRAGGESARIVIIPSASVEPEERARTYAALFRALGAAEVRAVHAEKDVSAEERDAIRRATGVFVTGGDQVKLMESMRSSGCVEAIREAVRSGAVYAGTSAGASAVSETMIFADDAGNVAFTEGLGLIPHAIVDQHFGERQRLSRLVIAAKSKRLVGVGIDEDTAVVWNGSSGEITVEGVGRVTVVDRDHRLHLVAPAKR